MIATRPGARANCGNVDQWMVRYVRVVLCGGDGGVWMDNDDGAGCQEVIGRSRQCTGVFVVCATEAIVYAYRYISSIGI
jgi:hypothetical protein